MNRIFYLVILTSLFACSATKPIKILNNPLSLVYSKESVDKLNMKIGELLEKSSCKDKIDNIYIYNIYHFKVLKKISKEEILNINFRKSLFLMPDNQTYPGYINSSAIILDANKDFIGVAEPNYFYCVKKYNKSSFGMEQFLMQEKEKFKIQYFFTFNSDLAIYVTYGIDINGAVYAFYKDKSNTYSVLAFSEFINLFWI